MADEVNWEFRGGFSPKDVGAPERSGPPQPAPEQSSQGRSGSGVDWTFRGGFGEPGVSWPTLTGQNLEGVTNAFDETFWRTATEQDREAEEDPRNMARRWSRPDATGVVVYDHAPSGLAFGDVFVNGVKQGNLLEGYQGATKEQGTEIMARLVLPREVWAKAYESEAADSAVPGMGRALTLAGSVEEELAKERKRLSENYAKGLSAADFEGDVVERTEDLLDHGGFTAGTIGAGAAGGAAWGVGIGSMIAPGLGTLIGGLVGGAVGAFSGWLNRDETARNLATAMEQYERAKAGGYEGIGMSDAIGGFAGVAMNSLSPLRNLSRGAYDSIHGETGDGISAYIESPSRGAWDVLDTAALVVDGIGTWGTRVGQLAYTGVMAATTGAGAASVAQGWANDNVSFNPYTGAYEEISTGGMLARTASVGIDAAQTGAASFVTKFFSRRGGQGMASQQGGWRVVTDAEGVRRSAGVGFSLLVPSEQLTALSARALARRSVARQGLSGEARKDALRRETARYIENLTVGRSGIATAAINAFGEGYEEIAQATLDAMAFGETPTMRELFDSWRQGAAMGAGMGVAVHRSSMTRSASQFHMANLGRELRGMDPISEERWKEMSESERAQAAALGDEQSRALVKQVAESVAASAGELEMASVPEVRRVYEAALQQAEQDRRNSQDAAEPQRMSTRLTPTINLDWGPQDYAVSLTAAIRDTQRRAQLLERAVQGEFGDLSSEDQPVMAAHAEAAKALLRSLEAAQSRIDAASSEDEVRAELRSLNELIRRMWSADKSTLEGRALRHAASVLPSRYPLNSAGSFQLLRLQISPEYTLAGNHQATIMPDAVQQPMGGDYDGDGVNNMLRTVLSEDTYEAMRYGAPQLGADGTLIKMQPFVASQTELLFAAANAGRSNPEKVKLANNAKARMAREIHRILEMGGIDARDRTRLVGTFLRTLSARQPAKAISGLLNTLATNFVPQMRAVAEELDASPWLAINRVIEAALQEFQTRYALIEDFAVSYTGATKMPLASKSMPRFFRRPTRATTEILTAAIQGGIWNQFRTQTSLKYNPLREPTVFTEAEANNALQALVERFAALNDGVVRSGDEAIHEGQLLAMRTQDWMNQLANDAARDLGVTANEALVYLSAMEVPDVDPHSRSVRSDGSITLLQAVLREVVARARAEYHLVLDTDETIARRLDALEALTLPDRSEGANHIAVGGRALVEVFGPMYVTELLGDDGAPLVNYTVRSLRDKIKSLRRDVREEFVASLKAHPQYSQELVGEPSHTPYRVLIDAVVEAANMELHETADHLAGGFDARVDAVARENFVRWHERIRNLASHYGRPFKTPQDAREFLSSNLHQAETTLRLVESRGLRAGMRKYDSNGELVSIAFPPYIYEVMAEPNPKRAEMMLLRASLRFARAGLSVGVEEIDVAKVNDRLLRLELDLNFRANDPNNVNQVQDTLLLQEYQRLLEESDSVDEFLSALNSNYAFRPESEGAPYMAWNRSVAVISGDRFGRGVSTVDETQEIRDALREAADRADQEMQVIKELRDDQKSKAKLYDAIRASRDDGTQPELWARYQKAFEVLSGLPNLTGASIYIEMAARINEIVKDMGSKGVSPENVRALAAAQVSRFQTYDTAIGRSFAAATSSEAPSRHSNMSHLSRERTYVLRDGTVVRSDGLDASQHLDMMLDPARRGLAARTVSMTQWDLNPNTGQLMLMSGLPQGAAGLVGEPEKLLFDVVDPDTGRLQGDQQKQFRRLSLLDGMALESTGGTPVLATHLAMQMNLRETAVDHTINPDTGEHRRMAVSLMQDIASALQHLASIENLYATEDGKHTLITDEETGEQVSLINYALRKAGRRARAEYGSQFAKMLGGLKGEARDAADELINSWVNKFTLAALKSDDKVRLGIAEKLREDYTNMDRWTSPAELLVDEFSSYHDPLTQKRILAMLRGWGDISNVTPWAREAIRVALNPNTPQLAKTVTDVHADGTSEVEETVLLPNLTDEQWHAAARAVIAYTMHATHGIATSSEVQISEFPPLNDPDRLAAALPFWDPSGVSVVLSMFTQTDVLNHADAAAAPLLAHQLELQRELAPQLETVSLDRAVEAVYKLFAPVYTDADGRTTGVVGQWHALLPSMYEMGVGAVMSSAAPDSIAMTGKNPARMRMFAASTEMDWSTRPGDDELSQVSVDAGSLIVAVGSDEILDTAVTIDLATGGGQREQTEGRLVQLEGRIATKVLVTLPDGREVDLLNHRRFGSALPLPTAAGEAGLGARALSLQTLTDSLRSLLGDMGVASSDFDKVDVTIDFFHPLTKTVSQTRKPGQQYSHNAWFDGIAGRTDAAFSQPSLLGFLYYGLDGMIPRGYDAALKSIKTLTSALQQMTTMPEDRRRQIEASMTTDMAGGIDDIVQFIMRQEIDGEPIPTFYYNAVRKFIELLYVVRVVEDGVPRVLSADEVIARQLRGEGFEDGSFAEAVGLPIDHVLAMMGELELANDLALLSWTPDADLLRRVRPYLGFPPGVFGADGQFSGFTRLEKDTEGNITGWATADIFDQPDLKNLALPRAPRVHHEPQVGGIARRPDSPFKRERAQRIFEKRANHPQASTKWAAQRVMVQNLSLQDAVEPPLARELKALQARLDGYLSDATRYVARSMTTDTASNDLTTDWLYMHTGSKWAGPQQGVLVSKEDIAEHGAPGDKITLLASSFMSRADVDDFNSALRQAKEVIDAIVDAGADVYIPTPPNLSSLANAMRQYVLERGYVRHADNPHAFGPAIRDSRSQATAAYHSMLDTVRWVSNQNRVLVELLDWGQTNENSILSVNGGIGALEHIFVRDVVQSARFVEYTPSMPPAQRDQVVSALHGLLSTAEGSNYLRARSQVKSKEQKADLERALSELAQRVRQVAGGARTSLLPTEGDEFGTGDIVPLASFDAEGKLVGLHLLRHGHKTVSAAELHGPLTAENSAISKDGLRITIDRAEPDDEHTTHRGVVVQSRWTAREGFMVELRVRTADLGSKIFEYLTGMKWTTTAGSVPVPTRPIFSNQPVLGVGDEASAAAKGADQEWLNTPSRVIAAVGFDTMPYLVRALTGVDYTTATDEEYATARHYVTELLREFRDRNAGRISAADVVSRSLNSTFMNELVAHIQSSLDDVMVESEGWTNNALKAVELLDESSPTVIADMTMLRLTLQTLMTGAPLNVTLGAPGFIDAPPGSRSHSMPPVFTTLLEQLPDTHPAKQAYVDQINVRLEKTRDENGDGYYLLPGGHRWLKKVTTEEGQMQVDTMLSYPQMRNTDHNSALMEQAYQRGGRGDVSATTTAMLRSTWGANTIIDDSRFKTDVLLDESLALHGGHEEIVRHMFNMGLKESPIVHRMTDDPPMTEAERRLVETKFLPARKATAVEIDDSRWYEGLPKATAKAQREEFNQLFNRVLRLAKLEPHQRIYLVEMIRTAVVRPASLTRDEGEFLTRAEAMAALRLIERNLKQKVWPLRDAAERSISRDALWAMYQGGYQLRRHDDTARIESRWGQWVAHMLTEVFSEDTSSRRYVASTNIVDGMLYEYRKDIKGLPLTTNPLLESVLNLVQTQNGVIVSNPMQRAVLNAPSVQNGVPVYDPENFESDPAAIEQLPQEAREMVERRMTTWETKHGLGRRKRQSARAEARRAAYRKDDHTPVNVALQYAQLAYVAKTMLNPALHIGSYLEIMHRAGQESIVSFLMGENLLVSPLTSDQRKMWREVRERLASNPEFYKMVYENTGWNPSGSEKLRFGEKLQKAVNFLTAMHNDPLWGRASTSVANAFMEAAWDRLQKSGGTVSVEQFLATLASNPSALAEMSADAVRDGYARIEYRRNLQDNLAERLRRKVVEGAIDKGGPLFGGLLATVLLRFPTLFFRFRSNTIINMMGLQGAHAVLSTVLNMRDLKDGDTESDRHIEDAIDLTRAFLRGGVSHTQLMMLGLMLGEMGFGGEEDEEDRFLSKLRRYQRTPVAKDPLSLENDFRNAEAWFADFLPGGIGVPTWITRMFVSPAMGIARFMQTGDVRQVLWGFEDALGNMPLLNLDTVKSSWEAALHLQAAAEADSMEDSVEATMSAGRNLLAMVAVLENILFESAFASMLYQAADDWDRDPYAVPMRSEGEIVRDTVYNTPLRSTALEDHVDPVTGESRKKYVSWSNDADVMIRTLTENRPMLAWAMSLIKSDETYIRTNMVPKIRSVDAEPLSEEEATRLIMAIVDNETGRETLTVDGAEAVVRGIHLGTVRHDSPALQGVYIPREMKQEIQVRVLEDLTAKYLELGYSKAQALSAAKAEFYGQEFGAPAGWGFADILWGGYIAEHPTQEYMQLNTTYALGPRGRPIATGVQRTALAAFGLDLGGLFHTFHAGQTSNLGVDQLLNSVDPVRGSNLGLRALVKIDETWADKTPEELNKEIIDALDDIAAKIPDSSDGLNQWLSSRRGFSRGGGGGGGGRYYYNGVGNVQRLGGQMVRDWLPDRIRPPYSDDLYSINTTNPNIRRATIRRERFASERGRLKQWQ